MKGPHAQPDQPYFFRASVETRLSFLVRIRCKLDEHPVDRRAGDHWGRPWRPHSSARPASSRRSRLVWRWALRGGDALPDGGCLRASHRRGGGERPAPAGDQTGRLGGPCWQAKRCLDPCLWGGVEAGADAFVGASA